MRRTWITAWTVGAVLLTALVSPAPTASAVSGVGGDCPEILAVDEVSPGMRGTGLTAERGTVPAPFDVEVVDVLEDALAPGLPLIIVEVASPEIDRVGGIWAGMSGSPVYVDGKLIGAIAYGFSFGPSKLGGVTPAAAMARVGERMGSAAATEAASVDEVGMSAHVQDRAAAAEGVSAMRASSMSRLEVPVRLSGPGGPKLDRYASAFEDAHPGTRVVSGTAGAGSAAGPGDIVAGGNVGVSLSYGDYSAVGVGTVTSVCNGVVTAFGHPMLFSGATRFGLHPASAVRVVDDPVFGPYKLANIGAVAGTVGQDRLAAVAGRLGEIPPSLSVATDITNRDDGRTVEGNTEGVWPDDLFGTVLVHGWIQYDSLVFDDLFFSGTSAVSWTVSGLRSDGSAFTVARDNLHASPYDLSTASLIEVAGVVQELQDNPFEEVELTDLDYTAEAGGPYRALEILPDAVTVETDDGEAVRASDGVVVSPGSVLRVRVPMRLRRGGVEEVEIELAIPPDVAGMGELTVTGSEEQGDWYDCFYDECGNTTVDSFDDLLSDVQGRARNDELTVSLHLQPDFPGEVEVADHEDGPSEPLVEARVRLDDVVTGYGAFPAFVPGGEGCPAADLLEFVDVAPDNPHADMIACAAALGLAYGVSDDPPRFAPERTVRRDHAAAFVARLIDMGPRPLPDSETRHFDDVDDNVHVDAIERLAAAGIVRGRSAATFDPATPVTRSQMATLLLEGLRYSTQQPLVAADGPYFPDVTGVHAPNIDAGFELGLFQGREDGTFGGTRTARRGQMASLLVRGYSVLTGD